MHTPQLKSMKTLYHLNKDMTRSQLATQHPESFKKQGVRGRKKGVYLIESGQCQIVNKKFENGLFESIGRGAIFGESPIFKSPVSVSLRFSNGYLQSLDYIGDIVALGSGADGAQPTQCIFVSYDNFTDIMHSELIAMRTRQMAVMFENLTLASHRLKQPFDALNLY